MADQLEAFGSIEDAIGSYKEDDEQSTAEPVTTEIPADGQQGDDQQQADPDQGDQGEPEVLDELEGNDIDPDQQTDVELQGGQFAPRTAKVKLEDGTITTVDALLKTGAQSVELTQRASALEGREREFETIRTQVRQQYEALAPKQELLAKIAQALMPKRPDPQLAATDNYAFTVLNEAYTRTVELINQLGVDHRQTLEQQKAEASAEFDRFKASQAAKLEQRAPDFANDAYYRTFWNDMIAIGGRVYGYSAKELNEGMNDHRQYLVMRDAIAYRKLKAAQAKGRGNGRTVVNGQVVQQGERKVMTGSNRPANAEALKRQQAQERFNKNPTAQNAMDLVD